LLIVFIVIDFVLKNGNKKISKIDFENSTKIKLKKKFNSVLNDLGFKGELKKVFFDVSKTMIYFRNNIKEDEIVIDN
jgi:hypothetical protein